MRKARVKIHEASRAARNYQQKTRPLYLDPIFSRPLHLLVRHVLVAELDTSGLEDFYYRRRSVNNPLDDLRGFYTFHCDPLVPVRIVLTCLDHGSALRESIEGIEVGIQIKNPIPGDTPPVDRRGISGSPYRFEEAQAEHSLVLLHEKRELQAQSKLVPDSH